MNDQSKSKAELISELAKLQRKISELEAQDSQPIDGVLANGERLAQVQRLARMGNWEWDIESDTSYWSDGLYRLLGLEPQAVEPSYQTLRERVHPQDLEQFENAIGKAIEQKRPFSFEHRCLLPSGSEHYLLSQGEPRYDANGHLVRLLGIMRDITGRKQSEIALQRHAIELATLQDTVLAITSMRDLPSLLQLIVEKAAALLHSHSGGMYLCEPEQEIVRCVVSYNTAQDYIGTTLKYGEGAAGLIAQTGQPQIIHDYRTWSQRASIYEDEQPFGAVLSVPMIWQGQVIGVIHVLRQANSAPFSQTDLELLTLFANHAAIAVQNTRLFDQAQQEIAERKQAEEKLRQHTAQLEALRELGLELTVQLDLDALLHSIVSRAISLADGTSGGYSLYRPRRNVLEWAVVRGDNMPPTGLTIQHGEALSGRVWESNQPIIVDDYRNWEHRLPDMEPYHPVNIMAVPVRWGDEFLGVLEVNTDTPNTFTPADAQVLQLFATQAAIAIRNARLYQDTNKRLAQTSALQQVTRAAASTLDFDKILTETCRTLLTTMQVEYLSVALPTQDNTAITFHPSHLGYNKPIYQLQLPLDRCVCGVVYQSGQAMLIEDVRQIPFYKEEGQGVLSELAVPIHASGKVIAVLNVESCQLNAFDEDDLAFFTAIANQLGVALENAHLFREEQRRRQEAETLRKSALVLAQDLDRTEVVEGILAQLQDVVPYDTASVQMLREKRLEIIGGRGFPNLDELLGISFSLDTKNNPNQEVMRSRAPFIVSDAPTLYNEFKQEPHAQADIHSWMGVPMMVGERLIGMIALDRHTAGFYTQEHANLAQAFAAQAAIAMENAHLFEAEHMARKQAEKHATQLRTRERYLAQLNQITRAALETPDLSTMLQTLADQLGELFEADECYLTLWDQETETTIPAAAFGDLRASYPAVQLNPGRLTLTKTLLQLGHPLTLDDMIDHPGVPPEVMDRFGDKALLGLPLIAGEQKLGAALIAYDTPRSFTQDEISRGQQAAGQIALAMAKARLLEAERSARNRSEMLYQVARGIIDAQGLPDLLQAIVDSVALTLSADRVVLFTFDFEQRKIRDFVSGGPNKAKIQPLTYDNLLEGLSGWVLREKMPALSPKGQRDPRESDHTQQQREENNCGAITVVPLEYRQSVMGTLTAINRPDQPDFSQQDAELMMAMANQAAIAIQNTHLFEETRRRAAHLHTLNIVMASAAAADSLSELLESTLDQVLQAMGLEMGAIWIDDQTTVRQLPIHRNETNIQEAQQIMKAFPEILVIDDWHKPAHQSMYEEMIPFVDQLGIRASITVPIMAEGYVTGGLNISSAEPYPWSENECALAEAVGRQLGEAAERLRLLHRTRQQAQQVEQIIRTVPEGVVLLDKRGRVVTANPAAINFLQLLASANVGDTLTHLSDQPLAKFLSSPPTWGLWHTAVIENPLPHIFEITSRPVESGTETDSWVLVIRDVTREREVQQRIQQQEQLAAVGQLAAGIAHDFNNIMAVISLYTQMLLRTTKLTPKARDRLETVNLQAKRAGDLIQQILDFSRRAVLERQMLNLVPLLKEEVKLLQRTLPDNIQLEFSHDDKSYHVHADPTRVQQIIMNLALNARDAMPEGGKLTVQLDRLEISQEMQDQVPELVQHGSSDGSGIAEWVRISIHDEGQGIPDEALPHIFEPFFTTKAPGKGTGLGLSQVYGIVRQHNGQIIVESEPGEGTTFTIYLPSLPAEEDERQILEMQDLPQGAGEIILVVEDNPVTREAVVDCLESLNYRIIQAENGQQALEIFNQREQDIALVLTDLVMPTMGGLALVRALRQRQSSAKVVVMTGHPMESYIKEIERNNFADWLQKPLNLDEMAVVIYRVLTGQN